MRHVALLALLLLVVRSRADLPRLLFLLSAFPDFECHVRSDFFCEYSTAFGNVTAASTLHKWSAWYWGKAVTFDRIRKRREQKTKTRAISAEKKESEEGARDFNLIHPL